MPPHLANYTFSYALKHILVGPCKLHSLQAWQFALKGSVHFIIHGHLGPPPLLRLPKMLGDEDPGFLHHSGLTSGRIQICLRP